MKLKGVGVLLLLLLIGGVGAYSYVGSVISPGGASNAPGTGSTTPASTGGTETNGTQTSQCVSAGGLPDPRCTPGSTDPRVNQSDIYSTICVSGYTTTVRPPVSYTEPLKYQSIQQYGYADKNVSHYEEDHLISLELGGSPTNVTNLWAQPHYGTYTSYNKDGFENYLHHMVCGGQLPLATAQYEIATNWVQYWVAAGEPKG